MATPRNTPDAVLKFMGLTFADIEPSRIEFFLSLAVERVEMRSPVDTDDDRSTRIDELRTEAELYLTAGYVWETVAAGVAIANPDNRIFSSGGSGMQIGADAPAWTEQQSAYFRASDRMFQRGEDILKRIRPTTATIVASDPLT